MTSHPFSRTRQYKGPIQAVILDLSGTALDHGCFGNVAAFQRAFQAFGLSPTVAEIRKPMGVAKREHVAAILAMPHLAEQWRQLHGMAPDDKAADLIFAKLLEVMPDTLADYVDPIPGCIEAITALRAKGIKIGATTAFSRSMMKRLLPKAAEKGFIPDCIVASDEVTAGRPWPWMCWRNCEELAVFPPEAAVKIGDTPADVEEGLNAGCWSVGVTQSSGALGLTVEQAMAKGDMPELETAFAAKLKEAGAHFIIPTIAGLPELCDYISELLAEGKLPLPWPKRYDE